MATLLMSQASSLPNTWPPIFVLRFTGYVLLFLTALDIADSLIPFRFLDPNWEFTTIGNLVELAPVPLIGLTFVFSRGLEARTSLERLALKPIATIALLLGVFYILLIPLSLSNSSRLQKQNAIQVETAKNAQLVRLQRLETNVNNASPERLQALSAVIDLPSQENLPNDPQALKTTLLQQLQTARTSITEQSAKSAREQRLTLIKTTVKWVLGSLVAGVGLLYAGYLALQFLTPKLNQP